MVPPSPQPAAAPRAVLLDLDDTLFDHALTCREAIRRLRVRTAFLRRRPLDELWQEYLALLDGPLAARLRGEQRADELRQQRWRLLAASCGEKLSAADVAELSRTYRDLYQSVRRPVHGAVELVERLHRVARIAIVTNNELAEQEAKLRFLGLGASVDALVVSGEVGLSKPDPGIFAEALRRVACLPEQAVMVGDSWANDVLGARAAGIRAIWFNRFGRPLPDGEDGGEIEQLRSLRPPREAEARILGDRATDRGEDATVALRAERPSGGGP